MRCIFLVEVSYETTVFFSILMKYAFALSKAEKEGNEEEIEKAKVAHDTYRDICLKADKMVI